MTEIVRFALSGILMIIGLQTVFFGVLGVFRFRFVLNRMHSAAMIDSMGIFCVLVSLVLAAWDMTYVPKLALILALLWIGSPITAHIVSRMEISTDETASQHMEMKLEEDDHGHL